MVPRKRVPHVSQPLRNVGSTDHQHNLNRGSQIILSRVDEPEAILPWLFAPETPPQERVG